MICSFLELLDLFRSPFLLYYNGTRKRSSALGFLSSFIIYAYLFYSFFQSNLYLKENPIVVTQNLQNQHADPIHFDESKFMAFGVSDVFNNRAIDPTIFTIQFRYFTNASKYEVKEIKVCDLEDVNGNKTLYDFYRLNYMFCLKNKSFYLEGTPEENARFIVISLFLCNNATSNNTCKSQEDLDKFFNNFSTTKVFAVIYDDLQINVDSYVEPFKKLNKVELQIVDPAVRKRSLINFKKATLATDSGWLFPKVESESNFLFSTKEFDFLIRRDSNQPVFQYLFFSSKEEIRYFRRYQTIADFLGGFAGVAKLISIICGIFVNNFLYIDTLKHILNKIYAFPYYVNEKISKKIHKLKNKVEKTDFTTFCQSQERSSFTKAPFIQMSQRNSLNTTIMDKRGSTKIPKHFQKDKIEKSIFTTQSENTCDQIIKTISESPGNAYKKELEKDSFVLEHFSKTSIPPEKDPKPNIKINLVDTQDCGQKINDLKKVDSPFSCSQRKENLKSEPKKKKLKERIVSFFKRKKDGNMQNKLHFSYWDYFSLIFDVFKSEKSFKHKLIRKAEKTYKEDLDIVGLVRKLHDLDKLKILLLDEDQLVIFNYLSKPLINLDVQEKEVNESFSPSQRRLTQLMNRGKNAELYLEESYQKVFEKTDKISAKLVEFFDQEIYRLGNSTDI